MPQLPHLNERELQYLHDQDFLKAKLGIQQRMQQLLGQTAETIRQNRSDLALPESVWRIAPKISRGENYEGLPYLVLDYPRIFQQEATFAYRTMLWWGWGFSCTLHLGGAYWQTYAPALLQNLSQLEEEAWWVCVHNTPWEYHYREDNYIGLGDYLQQARPATTALSSHFFKISRRLPLNLYQQLPAFSLESLQLAARLLKQ